MDRYLDARDPRRIQRRADREATSRRFTPEEDVLLGTDTDRAIASQLGRNEKSVFQRRQHLGIKAWKSGGRNRRIQKDDGYVLVGIPDSDHLAVMRRSDGYCLEHRLVMARHFGRPLARDESVHHRNGVRNDNRIENLELWTRSQPDGQRVDEIFNWCLDFIQRYADEVPT